MSWWIEFIGSAIMNGVGMLRRTTDATLLSMHSGHGGRVAVLTPFPQRWFSLGLEGHCRPRHNPLQWPKLLDTISTSAASDTIAPHLYSPVLDQLKR